MSFLLKLSLRNMQNKRLRTLIIYVTILISTFLLTLIFMAAIGTTNLNKAIVMSSNINYHARIDNLNSETIQNLKKDPLIESMLTSVNIAKVSEDNVNAYIVHNKVMKEGINQPKYEKGKQPVKENEIACSRELLEMLKIPEEVGTHFLLSYRISNEGEIKTKEFVLSGIIESSNVMRDSNIQSSLYTYSLFISEDFLNEQLKSNNFNIMTTIRLNTTSNTNYDMLNNEIDQLSKRYLIKPDSITKNISYLKATTNSGIETVLLTISISIMTVLFSCIVLYSVYSALTFLDIQSIGKLRVLGADFIQTKKTLYIENLIIALVGILSGMVLGYIISWVGLWVLYSKFNNIIFPPTMLPQLAIAIIIIILLGTMLSLRPVINNILSISPNQALHFNYNSNTNVTVRKSYSTISVNKLVKIDLFRNKKNVIVSIITMGISCMLFIATSTLLQSVSIENFVKSTLPQGDFLIKYNYSYDDKEYRQNNLNTKQLTGTIQEIETNFSILPGIEKIDRLYLALGDIYYPNTGFESKRVTIGTFSKDDIDYLNDNIDKGEVTYHELSEKPGIVYTWGHAFEKNGFNIGDEVTVSFLVGNTVINKTFILIASTTTMQEGTFLVPENILEEVFAEHDATYALALQANETHYYDIKQQLKEAASNKDLSLICIDEETAFAKEVLATIKYPILLVCVFMGIIGFITITNTMVVSMIRRRKEISLYRCLGLTSTQLFMMLFKQISVLVLGSTLISFPLGNLVGFILVAYAKQNSLIGVSVYNIPFSTMLSFVVVMLTITIIMTVCIQKFLLSKSAIEQLRAID